jgi:glycosyltransferase involved in cell wall biosynthesis
VKVAIVSGARAAEPMGLELAEQRLLDALRQEPRSDTEVELRVVGGRAARRHAQRIGGRWIPAMHGRFPSRAAAKADLVHLLGLDVPPPDRKPFIATVHDLAPISYDDEGALPPWTSDIVETARLVLTPSAFTASELVGQLSVPHERIRIIGGAPAIEALQAEPLSDQELRSLGIEAPFVLRCGGYTKRKNVPLLLAAWARVPVGTLVLTGPPQAARAELLKSAPSLERVVVLDYVAPELLARFLRSAAALASTSEYEGFGLPPLEAMAAGTPVVAVETPFVREMCGDAALLVDAEPSAVADALTSILGNGGAAALAAAGRSRAAQFSWAQTALAVLDAYSGAA